MDKINGKDFQNKVHWNLINLKALEYVPRIRHAANIKKYAPASWKNVPTGLWLEAAYRHLLEVMNEGFYAVDKEDHFFHIDKVLTNLILAIQVERKLDCPFEMDLYKGGNNDIK